MKTPVVTMMLLALMAGGAVAQDEPNLEATQKGLLNQSSLAIALDKQCKVLDTEQHEALVKGYAHIKEAALAGKMTGAKMKQADADDADSFGDDIVKKGVPCNETVTAIIQDGFAKIQRFELASTSPELAEATKYRNLYLEMAAFNKKCHFYVDEMTDIFNKKAEEQLVVISKFAPGYEKAAPAEAEKVQKAILAAPERACSTPEIQQMVTMSAWKATDTFAKTLVSTPHCEAGSKCDLPSKLFKK